MKRRHPEEEAARMQRVADAFNDIARRIESLDGDIGDWLPVRAAVQVVCGIDWARLSHSKRSQIGAMVRDRFLGAYGFLMTPVRLLRKTSGKGSHMIAVYPPQWLASIREDVEAMAFGGARAQPLLPFAEKTGQETGRGSGDVLPSGHGNHEHADLEQRPDPLLPLY